jgi:Leucine-rich repeat (LRR) protein
MGNLANLRELRANDNQLTALPPSIREVVKLEKVRLGSGWDMCMALDSGPLMLILPFSCFYLEMRSKRYLTILFSSRMLPSNDSVSGA